MLLKPVVPQAGCTSKSSHPVSDLRNQKLHRGSVFTETNQQKSPGESNTLLLTLHLGSRSVKTLSTGQSRTDYFWGVAT